MRQSKCGCISACREGEDLLTRVGIASSFEIPILRCCQHPRGTLDRFSSSEIGHSILRCSRYAIIVAASIAPIRMMVRMFKLLLYFWLALTALLLGAYGSILAQDYDLSAPGSTLPATPVAGGATLF